MIKSFVISTRDNFNQGNKFKCSSICQWRLSWSCCFNNAGRRDSSYSSIHYWFKILTITRWLISPQGIHNHDEHVESDDGHDGHDSHEGHGHAGEDEAGHDDSEYHEFLGKMGALIGIMYLFWLVESLMAILGSAHSHSHDHERRATTNSSMRHIYIRKGYTLTG